jgi:hypothetical protein
MEITIVPGKEVAGDEFNANLAEDMDEGQLTELSGDLLVNTMLILIQEKIG